MKRIGILGGSFDPIHIGHTILIQEAIQALSLDTFYVIPTKHNPWKDEEYTTVEHRLAMLALALKDFDKVKINTIELDSLDDKNFTIDTIKKLKESHLDVQFYYIMGMDQAQNFHRWKEAKEISELVQLVTFDRVGYTSNENIDIYHFIHLDIEPMKVASSDIRNGDILDLDPNVLRYIVKNGLYLETMIRPMMSKKRYNHTVSMAALARDIAISNGLDGTKAYVAGMLHDIAKEMDQELAIKIMNECYAIYKDKPYPVWHQWLSEYEAKYRYLVDDTEILQAIRHHTTASLTMSPLDMCIYVADKYDPYRDYDASKEIALCKKDILAGFKQCLKDFYDFSKQNNRKIDSCFFEIYKQFVEENTSE